MLKIKVLSGIYFTQVLFTLFCYFACMQSWEMGVYKLIGKLRLEPLKQTVILPHSQPNKWEKIHKVPATDWLTANVQSNLLALPWFFTEPLVIRLDLGWNLFSCITVSSERLSQCLVLTVPSVPCMRYRLSLRAFFFFIRINTGGESTNPSQLFSSLIFPPPWLFLIYHPVWTVWSINLVFDTCSQPSEHVCFLLLSFTFLSN